MEKKKVQSNLKPRNSRNFGEQCSTINFTVDLELFNVMRRGFFSRVTKRTAKKQWDRKKIEILVSE